MRMIRIMIHIQPELQPLLPNIKLPPKIDFITYYAIKIKAVTLKNFQSKYGNMIETLSYGIK